MEDFKDKVAVITGAANGIGRSLAHAFGKLEMKLVLTDIDEKSLNRVKEELEKANVDVFTYIADVTDRDQIEQLAEEAYKRYGKVNILCNNAGVLSGGPIHLVSLSDWDWVLDVNQFLTIWERQRENELKTFENLYFFRITRLFLHSEKY